MFPTSSCRHPRFPYTSPRAGSDTSSESGETRLRSGIAEHWQTEKMASAEAEFGAPESGNSPNDDGRQAASGDPAMTSPELVLVAGDEEAQRARESLEAIVPTDERINDEMRARAASQLRLAPPAAVAAAALPAAVPAAEPRPEPAEPEPVPATVAPAAEPPAKRPRRRVGPAIGLLALVPVAVAGLDRKSTRLNS